MQSELIRLGLQFWQESTIPILVTNSHFLEFESPKFILFYIFIPNTYRDTNLKVQMDTQA